MSVEAATGQTSAYLKERIRKAYEARYGEALPATVTFSNPIAVIDSKGNETGRVAFRVKAGKRLGNALYKPRHGSVWVDWE